MTFKHEQKKLKLGFTHIIGCDEVGRGSLAGPVVACALVLDPLKIHPVKSPKGGIRQGGLFNGVKDKGLGIKDIKDSKLLSSKKREKLSKAIKESALWSVAEVSPVIIDKINIHQATLLAMRKAVKDLLQKLTNEKSKVFIYIDGQFRIPNCDYKQEAIIGGDNKVLSIAAASIIAKVHRDNLMCRLHQKYPDYNFMQHKGYGTFWHRRMIVKHGTSPIHRLSFCQNIVAQGI